MKTREQRLEEALQAIQYEIVPSRIQAIADKALELEFEPVIGRIYAGETNDETYIVLWNEDSCVSTHDLVRPLTNEEWKEAGAPVAQPMTTQPKEYRLVICDNGEPCNGNCEHNDMCSEAKIITVVEKVS